MRHLWMVFGDGIDGSAKAAKEILITHMVLSLISAQWTAGAQALALNVQRRPIIDPSFIPYYTGHGHTVRYLNRERVSRYIALEPNDLMHPHIRAKANQAGFHEADGTLVVLSCGAEETKTILSTLVLASPTRNTSHGPQSTPPIDTIISVLTLCTVPNPQRCIADMVRDLLQPGGQFLMYEHVLSRLADVAWWQHLWAPIWSLGFDGCKMDRPSDVLVRDLKLNGEDGKDVSAWREFTMWKAEGDEESLFFHSVGKFIKV